jgi:hypothetical protein
MFKGRGKVRRFFGDAGAAVIAVEKEPGNVAALMLAPEVVEELVARYGIPDGGTVEMSGLIGLAVEYDESSIGIATRVVILDRE